MDNNHKIIIAALIGIIIVLGGAIAGTLLKEPYKTVELFENGTTMQVPADTSLKSHDEFSTTYITGKNTTVIAIDNNNLIGALASKLLSTVVVEKGEKKDNGLYTLDKNSIMEIADKLGLEYDENNVINVFAAIKHNNTVNQSVIMIGIDEGEMINMMNSIQWKEGVHSNATNASDINASSSLADLAQSGTTNDNPTISDAQASDANDYGSYNEPDDYYDDSYDDYESDSSSSSSSGGSSSGGGSSGSGGSSSGGSSSGGSGSSGSGGSSSGGSSSGGGSSSSNVETTVDE